MKDPFLTKDYDGNLVTRKQTPGVIDYKSQEFIDHVNRKIEEGMARIFGPNSIMAYFPNHQSAYLFMDECVGQISDGKYENSNIDYKWYSSLCVQVSRTGEHSLVSTEQSYIRYSQPRRRLRFTDLMWLFDGPWQPCSDPNRRDDCRLIFSNCPTNELRVYLQQVADTINVPKGEL